MVEDKPLIVVQEGPRSGHYTASATEFLGGHARLAFVDCGRDVPLVERERQLDALLPSASAVVSTPWLGGTAPGLELPAFNPSRWDRAPNLKVIAGTYDFRMDWIDPSEAELRGVVLIDTSRTMTPTVAEFGVAMTLNLLRCIPSEIETVRAGEWTTSPPDGGGFVYGDLSGRRVGLAGYGSINRHFRRFIRPFECEVRAYDPLVSYEEMRDDGVAATASLVDVAAHSEILVVAIPPTPKTMGVIDNGVLGAMPKGSLFVLLSRMAVVDQASLWRRVSAGELRVAVDVYDPEPPPREAWFRTAPNVLPTPHIAGSAVHAHQRCFREACDDTLSVLSGHKPRHQASIGDKTLYDGTRAGL